VAVPQRLPQPHPSITAAQAAWRNVHVPPGGCRVDLRHRHGSLHVFVGRSSLPRVWSLANAVFTEATRRGHTIINDTGRCGGPHLMVDGYAVEISFWEEIISQPYVLSPKEIADAAKYPWQRYPQFERVPTGRLQLRHGQTQRSSLMGRCCSSRTGSTSYSPAPPRALA
jgi:hypothetical protein